MDTKLLKQELLPLAGHGFRKQKNSHVVMKYVHFRYLSVPFGPTFSCQTESLLNSGNVIS